MVKETLEVKGKGNSDLVRSIEKEFNNLIGHANNEKDIVNKAKLYGCAAYLAKTTEPMDLNSHKGAPERIINSWPVTEKTLACYDEAMEVTANKEYMDCYSERKSITFPNVEGILDLSFPWGSQENISSELLKSISNQQKYGKILDDFSLKLDNPEMLEESFEKLNLHKKRAGEQPNPELPFIGEEIRRAYDEVYYSCCEKTKRYHKLKHTNEFEKNLKKLEGILGVAPEKIDIRGWVKNEIDEENYMQATRVLEITRFDPKELNYKFEDYLPKVHKLNDRKDPFSFDEDMWEWLKENTSLKTPTEQLNKIYCNMDKLKKEEGESRTTGERYYIDWPYTQEVYAHAPKAQEWEEWMKQVEIVTGVRRPKQLRN